MESTREGRVEVEVRAVVRTARGVEVLLAAVSPGGKLLRLKLVELSGEPSPDELERLRKAFQEELARGER